ncbi:ergothioneine biosynthesis protein EgtC [Streptomyces sp. NPDC052020]|uniref:ergothioneine biosynthesis protein EgtC n=1 Tax=Streptomyces sp. NPDC052020 TaxID=3155677 RepID=UPI00343698A0
MCRHLAYTGPAEPLGRLLVEPPHGLYRQSWAPRRQRHGTVNADGFGVGWYAEGDPVPARYRRAGPIWADQSFADLARVVRTTALLGAVRDATLSGADAEAAAAPFAAGPWLFSHNGAVAGWPGALAPLAPGLPPGELLALEARNDSAFVWALVLNRLRGGREEPSALAETVAEVAAAAPASRLNLLLTNGVTLAATAWGDTLWYLSRPGGGTVVASEPYDDDPRWREVPDRTLLWADRTDVLLTPLKDAAPADSPEAPAHGRPATTPAPASAPAPAPAPAKEPRT